MLQICKISRIIIVSSLQHEKGFINWDDLHFEKQTETYKGFTAYNQSKLANVMHAAELARRVENFGIRVYALHPGMIYHRYTYIFHP